MTKLPHSSSPSQEAQALVHATILEKLANGELVHDAVDALLAGAAALRRQGEPSARVEQKCPRCGQLVATMVCLKNHRSDDKWCPDSGRNMDAVRAESPASLEEKIEDLGGVSPTAVDAIPCSVPTDAASHAEVLDGLGPLRTIRGVAYPLLDPVELAAVRAGSSALRVRRSDQCPHCQQTVETMVCLKNHRVGEKWCPDSGRNMEAFREVGCVPEPLSGTRDTPERSARDITLNSVNTYELSDPPGAGPEPR